MLGPGILLVGVANGGIGFKFADSTKSIVWYAIAVVVVVVIMGVMMFLKRRQKKASDYKESAPTSLEEARYGGYQSNIALRPSKDRSDPDL